MWLTSSAVQEPLSSTVPETVTLRIPKLDVHTQAHPSCPQSPASFPTTISPCWPQTLQAPSKVGTHNPSSIPQETHSSWAKNTLLKMWGWQLESEHYLLWPPRIHPRLAAPCHLPFWQLGTSFLPSSSGQPLPGWSLVVTFLVTVTKNSQTKAVSGRKGLSWLTVQGMAAMMAGCLGRSGKGRSAVLSSLSPLHSDWDPSSQDGTAFIQSGSL